MTRTPARKRPPSGKPLRISRMSANYWYKTSFNPGVMCLNLLICAKNTESILPAQITALTRGNRFNPPTPSRPFKSFLLRNDYKQFRALTCQLCSQTHSLVKNDSDLSHAVARRRLSMFERRTLSGRSAYPVEAGRPLNSFLVFKHISPRATLKWSHGHRGGHSLGR